MQSRYVGNVAVSSIGLGCMNLSHAYGPPTAEEQAKSLLHLAIDLGVNHFDTATLYGFGANEALLGCLLKPFRPLLFLASKCGMGGVDGKRVIDGRPETIKAQCDASLKRLQTEYIDLYYLHRWDKKIPIAESVGALADLVSAGKIRYIGLSEVSVATLKKAQQEHPITAVQNEYSLWTRNPEIGMVAACKEMDIALVAFSPLGRAFLANSLRDVDALTEKDIRKPMPRFTEAHFAHNLSLLDQFVALANQANCTPAQLALAWLLSQGDHILPIPGTTNLDHLTENFATVDKVIDAACLQKAAELINQTTVSGDRYVAAALTEVDAETFE